MINYKTKFKGLVVFKNQKYKDRRGFFIELLRNKYLNKSFPFVVCSYSKKNVLRGMHLQMKKSQGKYISVIKGKIYDVCVDLRKNSKTFGKYFSIILSEKNCNSLYIPPGFAHGFYTMSKENYVVYSCTNYRHSKSEVGIIYNDKDLKIKWPAKNPVL